MADVKISQLPAATTPVSGTEELPLVQSGVTKKIALSDLSSISFGATGLTPATATSGAVVVAGTLDVNNGGTGLPTLTANNVILGNGTSTPTFVAPSTGGNVLTSNGTTWVSSVPATSGTVTSVNVSGGTTGLTTSGGPITTSGVITLAGTLDVDNGGTGLTSGTSGGVLAYTATGTLASSAALTQYGVVYGGGAGAVPVATAAGTTGQVLTATTSGAPSWASPATSGTVTSVAMTVPSVLSISGSPITSSGTLALTYSGTALPVANGGTGVTTSTGTTNVVLSNSPTLVTPDLGTPASGTVTNLTGTASININGTVGATTPGTGAFTTLSATGTSTLVAVNASGEIRRNLASDAVYSASTLNADHGVSVYNGSVTSNSYASIEFINRASGTAQAGISSVTSASTTSALAFQVMTSNVISEPMRLSGTGLAVTGALSATGTLSGGTSGTAYSFSGSAPATSLTLDSSGNLGLGVTPSAWTSPYKAIEVGFAGCSVASFSQTSMELAANAKYTSSNDRFAGTGYATKYQQSAGVHRWYTSSASGTLDNVITFTQAMTLDASGIVTMNAYGAGAATFSAAGVISSVSDETWKIKDGVPVDTDAMLKKLEPGYWYYNDEKKETFGAERQLGFYAQNVNAAIGPEAAPTPEEGKPWGYYDRSVLAITVMSLQKALATIELLTARITALETA